MKQNLTTQISLEMDTSNEMNLPNDYKSKHIYKWELVSAIIFAIISLIIFFYTILSHVIPYAQYKKSISDHPNSNFLDTLSIGYDFLHYITGFFFSFAFGVEALALYKNCTNKKLIIILVSFFISFILEITYLSLIRKTSIVQFGLNSHMLYSTYLSLIGNMTTENPSMLFSFYGSYGGSTCTINRYTFSSNYSEDISNLSITDDDVFIANVTVDANWSTSAREYFSNLESKFTDTIPKSYDDNEIQWNIVIRNELNSYFTPTIVEKEPSSKLSRKIGNLMTTLFSGVGYVYTVASVPLHNIEVRKVNLSFYEPSLDPEFWNNFGKSLKCFNSKEVHDEV